jgi:hypothetical protein
VPSKIVFIVYSGLVPISPYTTPNAAMAKVEDRAGFEAALEREAFAVMKGFRFLIRRKS